MNQYVTGKLIKSYREKKNMTQQELASVLNVSFKTISKWETGNGFPDVSILEELAKALNVSLSELFSGEVIENKNTSSNMLLTGFYICPICGNVIMSIGDSFVSCHGINLIKEEAIEKEIEIENIEDDLYVTLDSPMSKNDYISFVCAIRPDGIEFIKLYPEQDSSVRIKKAGVRKIYYYSKREGLFYYNIKSQKRF